MNRVFHRTEPQVTLRKVNFKITLTTAIIIIFSFNKTSWNGERQRTFNFIITKGSDFPISRVYKRLMKDGLLNKLNVITRIVWEKLSQ